MNNETGTGIVGLIVIGLIIWGLVSWIGGEQEGIVNTSDCRSVVTLQSNTLQKYYKKFTCEYLRDSKGEITGGTCAHVNTNSTVFSSGSACETAYVYQVAPQITCPDTTNGYLDTSSGQCMCKVGHVFNTGTNKCEVATDSTTSLAPPTGTLPTAVGQCDNTTVSNIGYRLDGVPSSGSWIRYADGGMQVSYDAIPGVQNSSISDGIKLCLISIPTDCPAGDNRGRVYQATNARTGETWEAQDSSHSCGGA